MAGRVGSVVLLSLLGVGMAAPAHADYSITAPAPGRGDFLAARKASRAVNRALPLQLRASEKPQAKVVAHQGALHEHATVIANVDFETFLRRLDPARWSYNLPQRWGGEVRKLRDTRTAERKGRGLVLQQERMVLGVPALDMTKNSIISVHKDRARVEWQVTHSDPSLPALGRRTVLMDDGWVEFARTADNRVRISSRSAHRISTLPSLPLEKLAPGLADKLAAASLRNYFRDTVSQFKQIAEGGRPAR